MFPNGNYEPWTFLLGTISALIGTQHFTGRHKNKSIFKEDVEKLHSLFEDNLRIFQSFGPNSSARFSDETLRIDLSVWESAKKKEIISNNREVAEIVKKNYDKFASTDKQTTDRLLNHISAFEEHVNNPRLDYSDHQFPRKFTYLIERLRDEKVL